MKFPSSFKLGGMIWTIEVIDASPEFDSDNVIVGQCYQLKRRIVLRRIDDNIPLMANSLLHEIIHAVDEHLKIGLKEKHVRKLADGLFEVLSDNPELLPAVLGIDTSKKVCYKGGK